MACYHPLRRFTIGINPDTGKSIGKVVPFAINYLILTNNKKWQYCTDDIDKHFNGEFTKDGTYPESALFYDFGGYAKKVYANSIEIPCGKCIGCRLNYGKQWAVRLMLEKQYHKETWFLTLTYNDAMLPTDIVDGKERHPLVKKDVQNFIKRLRRRFPPETVHYYCCGEYGSQTMRPHYHMILFLDVPLESIPGSVNKLHKVENGYRYYVNSLIEDLWYRSEYPEHMAGFHYLCNVDYDCCAYVSKYVTKKLNGDMSYSDFGLTPVFSIMSSKPAIGRRYFEEHGNDIYEQWNMLVPGLDRPLRVRPPKYFDNLFDIENHEELCEYKAVRKKAAEDAITAKMLKTDKTYLEVLETEEEVFKAQAAKRLKDKMRPDRKEV